jgi:hypothetical protein
MAVIDEQQVAGEEVPRCPDCGGVATQVHYCTDCQQAIGPAPAPAPPRRKAPVLAIAIGAVVLAAIAIVIVIVVASGSSSDQGRAFRQKLTNALTPLVRANRTLSSSLQTLHGRSTQTALSAADRTQHTLLVTRDAVAAVAVPTSERRVSRKTQLVLAQENAYLQSVIIALAEPADGSVSTLPTLAAATANAFASIAPVAPNGQTSIFGTNALLAWARSQTTAQRRRALASRSSTSFLASALSVHGSVRSRPGAPPSAGAQSGSGHYATPSGSAVPGYWSYYQAPYASAIGAPYAWAGGQSCDQNIFAGDNTSCPFAANIFQVVAAAWHYDGVIPAAIVTYSPVTNSWYALACTEYWGTDNQSDLQCLSGDGSGAAFPVWAAQAYYNG